MLKKFVLTYVPALKFVVLVLLIGIGTRDRVTKFVEPGKDSETYVTAITSFLEGKNPYEQTVKSYENINDVGGHGFAYFPGFLYLLGALYVFTLKTGVNFDIIWKTTVLLFDLGIGVLLYKHLVKSSYFIAIFGALVWLLNPYLKADYTSYSLLDPIPIFFILLALLYIEKDNVLTAVFFTISIVFKPFALVFIPLFIVKSKNKLEFVTACALVFTAVSLPFLVSIDSALTYIKGSLLVHGSRVLQGRPFLFYLSYYYKIELFQIIPLAFYSSMATFFGWVLIVAGRYVLKIRDVFVLAALAGVNFLLFTPVLNRTYLLWFLPIFIICAHEISKHYKKMYLYYFPLLVYWGFCYWYLNQWKDGFHVWHP